jgi:osmoprotectant transport system permease protein
MSIPNTALGSVLVNPPQPIIPDYGEPDECVRANGEFCLQWFLHEWPSIFAPALVQHIELSALAVLIGFSIAFWAALAAHRYHWVAPPVGGIATFVYIVPPLALFELLVPLTGLSVLTVEIALVGYTLLGLFRNILTGLQGVSPAIRRAGVGMGLTRTQILWRIEIPIAVPAIISGLRMATVLTISLSTVAAFVIDDGLGSPILKALQSPFNTQFIAAAALAILLALAADAAFVILGRVLTPWARARRAA